ncbi:MAG: indole acetimide hydrolase [Actinomycetia bacterium]|nr:indole acetimide hydrolase [Actinomycetes bacterium]
MSEPSGRVLWRYSASELAAVIAGGQASSVDVVSAHIDRIAEVNPKLNAITVEMADEALAAARRADATAQDDRGPLHGVPFTIKENIDQMGYATTNGVAALAEAEPSEDAVTVARMKAAGAIAIGRTNLPEFGLRVATENAFRGRTMNPWSRDHTAGGSSGGEGSAIASGMSPIGIGNDIGGSIRNPALCCGGAGLKATSGRIPRVMSNPPGDPGLSGQLMSVEGPMARTIADLRLGLEVMAGRSPRDPRTVDAPLFGAPAVKRAGVVRSIPGVDLSEGALGAVDEAAAALEADGWQIDYVDPPELERVKEVWAHLLAFDFRSTIDMLDLVMGDDEVELLRTLIEWCRFEDPSEATLFTERSRIQRAWSQVFSEHSVLLGPGWTTPPFEHGEDVAAGRQLDILHERLGFIVPANVLGFPAVALSTGVHDGLPVGVQVYADHWREDLCLAAAAVVEAENPAPTPIDPVF